MKWTKKKEEKGGKKIKRKKFSPNVNRDANPSVK